MTLPAPARAYILGGIAGTPVVLNQLLGGIFQGDPVWDARPDPARFTLREAIAHLADWEEIFLERVERTLVEAHPHLPSVDEGKLCQERNYAAQDGPANLRRFAEGRAKLSAVLQTVPEEAWDRTCHREFVGDITLDQLAAMILGHDAYHLKQAAEYVSP